MKKILALLLTSSVLLTQIASQARKTEVWDFGGVADLQPGVINHISTSDIEKLDTIALDGKFQAGDVTFGDLTYNAVANDRAYNNGKKNYGVQGYSTFDFGDGYTSSGMFYCNGTGGEGRRYLLIKNVKAGDVITFYARLSNSSQEKINFVHLKDDMTQSLLQAEKTDIEAKSKKYEYIATQSGTYKVFTDTNGGKPVYYRLKRTPGVVVTGSLNGAKGNVALKFQNQKTGQEISATVAGSNYSVALSAGYDWTAVLQGMKGYGVQAQDKVIKVTADALSSGKMSKNLTVAEQKTFKITGTVTGLDTSKLKKDFSLLFTVPEGSTYQDSVAEVTINGANVDYSADLEPAVEYTAILLGANDFAVVSGGVVNAVAALSREVKVQLKPTYDVKGKFFSNDKDFSTSDIPNAIEFLCEDGYTYKGTLQQGGAYSANLRSGVYTVVAESLKYIATNHVVVKDATLLQDIKMSPKDKTLKPLALKKDLYVGGKKGTYATLGEAVLAAKAMNPKQESERITIHIAPGVYREQVIIDTPYITLLNDTPTQEVKLTWYYGIGYKYYSVSNSGYYDSDLAFDKIGRGSPARWGVATYIKPTAQYFRAKDITFETSFNKYVTDEEISDGVIPDGSLPFTRKINSDVLSKAATERSAALCSEGDYSEYLNCRFLGSQDTLYTGANTHQYYRNCFIEGNTDFIFGDGDVVFENCEVHWAGYTDRQQAGYLTASRNAISKGYLFYNCIISQEKGLYYSAGYLGRPWGKDAKVAWINTILGSDTAIDLVGWTSMSGNAPEKAGFREYNTQWASKAVDTTQRTQGTLLTSEEGFTPKDFLGQWQPEYTAQDKLSLKAKLGKNVSFTSDDDINTPYAGHTLTLHYTLGKSMADDVSLISWYRVAEDGKETLVKQSTGYGDKSYAITKEDAGCKIKAVLVAKLRSGKNLGEKSCTLDAKVRDGVAVSAKAVGGTRVASKVNIFLAGDSTVKDYGALGMYSGGKIRDEGAWGEFLGCFFNDSVAIQNYSNGGRSSRNFINEGSLDKIKENISRGDYLFIQFGHNDCSNQSGYLEDRYVPLGKDNKGIYPVTSGKKVATPASYASKYGAEFYSYDCGGTYKWYLKQYIDVAKEKGAIPVLVTPVSRQYFDENGKIKPHHDSTDKNTKTQITENNAYVEAVRQLAKEENVALLDGFEITKALYEETYTKAGAQTAKALMFSGDSTHNNKLGGFVIASLFAKNIKSVIPALSKAVISPTKAIGENNDGKLMFSVDSKGNFTCDNEYWTKYTTTLLQSLKAK